MDLFLHVRTLLVVGALVGSCVAASLLLIWAADRGKRHALAWAMSFAFAALTMILSSLRDLISPLVSVHLTNVALLLCYGFSWYGYRQFFGVARPRDLPLALAGSAVWLTLAHLSPLATDLNARVALTVVFILVYIGAIAATVVKRQDIEALPSLTLMQALLVVHAGVQLLRLSALVVAPADPTLTAPPVDSLTRLQVLEAVIFAIFAGLLQLTLIGQRAEWRFRQAAETDPLTGLANRRYFLDRVETLLRQRPAEAALIIFDIDHFKTINDNHGHLAGDAALMAFARLVEHEVRATDVLARIGGEEFALFLPGTTLREGRLVANRVRRRLRDITLDCTSQPITLSVSAGVASIADTGSAYEALYRAADSALYAAKRAGRDRVCQFDPPEPASDEPMTDDMPPSLAV